MCGTPSFVTAVLALLVIRTGATLTAQETLTPELMKAMAI